MSCRDCITMRGNQESSSIDVRYATRPIAKGEHMSYFRHTKCYTPYPAIAGDPGIILWMRPANERRRYNVTSSLIGWEHSQNDPWWPIGWGLRGKKQDRVKTGLHVTNIFKGKGITVNQGWGRVPDLRVRVQVWVLVICMSTSASTSTWLLYEYESEYWLTSASTSMSTGLWSTFYISSSIEFFSLWRGNPQILINLEQSSNCLLSMIIIFVNISV